MGTVRRQSHVHAREYWGEFDAAPLLQWLNRKGRPPGDPIEKLIVLNQHPRTPPRDVAREIKTIVSRLVRRSKLAIAPAVGDVTIMGWSVAWHPVGNMAPLQALALIRVLQLAEKGLLGSVRQCVWSECERWFFARFKHQVHCSTRCQQRDAKAKPEFKAARREYMRRLRRQKKLREMRERQVIERERKAKRRPR